MPTDSEKFGGGCAAFFGLLLFIPVAIYGYTAFSYHVTFQQHVAGRLKRAADSNTVDLAKGELEAVLGHLESHGMTTGSSAVFYQTPKEDVGFWYTNLKAAQKCLSDLPPPTSAGEKDMVLMKLRQTLLDHADGHEVVTLPTFIEWYPNITFMVLFEMFSILAGIIGGILVLGGAAVAIGTPS